MYFLTRFNKLLKYKFEYFPTAWVLNRFYVPPAHKRLLCYSRAWSSYFSSSSYSVSTVLTKPCTFKLRMRLLQYATNNYYTRSRKSKWLEVFAKCQVRWAIITAISTFLDWIRVYIEKLVNALKSHKTEYVPMHTIRVITRIAQNSRRTVRASDSSRLCLSYASIITRDAIWKTKPYRKIWMYLANKSSFRIITCKY